MAQYNGYVSIPHGTYDEWRAATLGNGYNADYMYGNQCWDYCAELWHQYNLTLITRPGGGGAADCWLISRIVNASSPFKAVTGKENIKRGDVIVFDRSRIATNGHIGIADEDYHGGDSIKLLSQAPASQGLNGVVFRTDWSLGTFLGIFRNTKWETSPTPTPQPKKNKKREGFPWPVAWTNWGW